MREVGAEAVLRLQAPGERLEQTERDLLLRAAAAADQVSVTLDVRAVPARHPVVEMGVRDVAEVLEGLEVAVDGRGIDLRIVSADLPGDLVSGGVMPCPAQGVENEPALDGHAPALRPDLVADICPAARGLHTARVRQSQ